MKRQQPAELKKRNRQVMPLPAKNKHTRPDGFSRPNRPCYHNSPADSFPVSAGDLSLFTTLIAANHLHKEGCPFPRLRSPWLRRETTTDPEGGLTRLDAAAKSVGVPGKAKFPADARSVAARLSHYQYSS
jgi:hypothetical protein